MLRRICAVTSTRADWGALEPVLSAMRDDGGFDLKLVATGQHLSAAAGNTIQDIVRDGFSIHQSLDMRLVDDTPKELTVALATCVAGFGGVFEQLKPEILLVPGDRYEILGVVFAAALARIPVAHIGGGDVTEGAMDDAFRHAITKMSHLHFVTNADAGCRVEQLGEDPQRVFVVGSSMLDRMRKIGTLERGAFFEAIGFSPKSKNLLITFHPETLALDTEAHCTEMLKALEEFGPDVGLIFSGSNADVQGFAIGNLVAAFVEAHANAVLHPSLGSLRYFSALRHADAVVGNSSSGLYEAPSFGTPTINIGDRQKGRIRATSVIDVPPQREAIGRAIRQAFERGHTDGVNPFGDGHAAERIVSQLKAIQDPARLLVKRFVDWPHP